MARWDRSLRLTTPRPQPGGASVSWRAAGVVSGVSLGSTLGWYARTGPGQVILMVALAALLAMAGSGTRDTLTAVAVLVKGLRGLEALTVTV